MNEKEIQIFAMKRSGQHAIIQWLIDQHDGALYFRNNILNSGRTNQRIIYRNVPEEDRIEDQQGNFCDKQCFMFNVEDPKLGKVQKQLKKHDELPWGESKKIFKVLIVRDAYNLFASRLLKGRQIKKMKLFFGKDAALQWMQHIDEYSGETCHLGNDLIKINFNRWFIDKQYRKRIAEQLELKFTDKGINTVSSFGDGSSFDGLKYNGNASKMKVLERWKDVANDEEYKALFTKYNKLKTKSREFFDMRINL